MYLQGFYGRYANCHRYPERDHRTPKIFSVDDLECRSNSLDQNLVGIDRVVESSKHRCKNPIYLSKSNFERGLALVIIAPVLGKLAPLFGFQPKEIFTRAVKCKRNVYYVTYESNFKIFKGYLLTILYEYILLVHRTQNRTRSMHV